MKHFGKVCVLLMIVIGIIGCSNEGSSTENVSINETRFPIVDEQITITMVGQKAPNQANWEDMSIIQEYEEMTNIHIEWDTPSADAYTERFNLLMGSGDYPDAFFGGNISSADKMEYGEEGILIPLEDLIDEYAPNFKKLMDENPDLRRNITTPDSHIYNHSFHFAQGTTPHENEALCLLFFVSK